METPILLDDGEFLVAGGADDADPRFEEFCADRARLVADEPGFRRYRLDPWKCWNALFRGTDPAEDARTWFAGPDGLLAEPLARSFTGILRTWPRIEAAWRERTAGVFPGRERWKDEGWRPDQRAALEALEAEGGRSGVLVLPGGSGKTRLGLAVAAAFEGTTVIETPDGMVRDQWIAEAARVGFQEGEIGTAETCRIRVTSRPGDRAGRGCLIVDECHLFRPTPGDEALPPLRFGLTATLAFRPGDEEAFALFFGPALHRSRSSAAPVLRITDVRVAMTAGERAAWLVAGNEQTRKKLAAGAAAKLDAAETILTLHADAPRLVFSDFTDPLRALAARRPGPLITGATSPAARRRHLDAFRSGKISLLYLSAVGDAGLDLPTASVLIQLSFRGGDAVQENQRTGRLLRVLPGKNEVSVYTLVTEQTEEETSLRDRRTLLDADGFDRRLRQVRFTGATTPWSGP